MNPDFEIDVADIPPAKLLAALYNDAHAQGMGWLNYKPEPMTEADAQKLIDERERGYPGGRMYFDYVQGRVMKVEINGKKLDPWLYDRDNGEGAAQSVVDKLRKEIA